LIIEAYAILFEHLADCYPSLRDAHDRALQYAEANFSLDDIRDAWVLCSTVPEPQPARPHWSHFGLRRPVLSGETLVARRLKPGRREPESTPAAQ